MNKKYIKENKTLVREFLGALGQSSRSEKEQIKLVKRLTKQSPENAKKVDDMQIRHLTKDIEIKLNNLEKTNPANMLKILEKNTVTKLNNTTNQ